MGEVRKIGNEMTREKERKGKSRGVRDVEEGETKTGQRE